MLLVEESDVSGVSGSGSDRFAEEWLAALAASENHLPAADLYSGRAFSTVRRAADIYEAELGVISAGLGFIMADTEVPSYSLTIAGGDDALSNIVPTVSAAQWWLTSSSSIFATSLSDAVHSRNVTLIALTQPYARMIAPALEQLAPSTDRLRLFGLGIDKLVPASARRSIIPYDRRAEHMLSGGTLGEFSARALSFHLSRRSSLGWNLDAEVEDARRMVAEGPPPREVVRRRVSDDEIRALVKVRNVTSARLFPALHDLRAQGIACGSERLNRILSASGGIS